MPAWLSRFRFDPIAPLTGSGGKAVRFFANRDLLSIDVGPIEELWLLPEVLKILSKQAADGSWGLRKSAAGTGPKHALTETWKNARFLIEHYQLTRAHPGIEKAADYLFSCQTGEGDIRGILANQYAPYYTGAILYLLIKAGFQDDARVHKGISWLLSMRQNDGGWVIGSPGLLSMSRKEIITLTSQWTSEPSRGFDRSKPFSAAGTGMVLRAFAAHPDYKHSEAAIKAAMLLKSKLFKEDNWSSYRHPDNWIRFQFPFWWTNIVSALDTLSSIGIAKDDADVKAALEWLIGHQQPDGLWNVSYSSIHKATANRNSEEQRLWISLSICRIMKRYFGMDSGNGKDRL